MDLNEHIIQELEKLARECRSSGRPADKNMASTYSKAITGIKELTTPITSGSEAKKIKGIGNFLAQKIDVLIDDYKKKKSSSQIATQIFVPHAFQSVKEWLTQIGMSSYIEAFIEAGYDNFIACEALTDQDLDIMAITKAGHRKTLMLASKDLKSRGAANAIIQNAPVAITSVSTPLLQNSNPSHDIKLKNGGALPKITDGFLNTNCSAISRERGRQYYLSGAISKVVVDGDILRALVKGSEALPYDIHFDINVKRQEVLKARCSCPVKDGWLAVMIYIQNGRAAPAADNNSQLDDEEPKKASKKPRKKADSTTDTGEKKTKKPRKYLPIYRSGPWALLVALYESQLDPDYIGYTSKVDLIKAASTYTDTSFQAGSQENGFYSDGRFFFEIINLLCSHRSSMSTLITKSLVSKAGNPARFNLTESGLELAKALHDSRNGAAGAVPPVLKEISLPIMSPVKLSVQHDKRDKELEPTKAFKRKLEEKSEDHMIDFRMDNDFAHSDRPVKKMRDEYVPSISETRPNLPSSNVLKASNSKEKVIIDLDDSDDGSQDLQSSQSSLSQPIRSSSMPLEVSMKTEPLIRSNSSPQYNLERSSTSQTSSYSSSLIPASSTSNSLKETPIPTFTEGSPFEVVLLLDYREIKKPLHKTLYKSLKTSGIRCEKRQLDVGDIMWIARRTIGSKVDELVIDYIIERKKHDDLRASLEDGRYKEQKFRLNKCGIKHKIYLLEGSLEVHSEPFEHALINTQIKDGFFIQRTSDEGETFAYLMNLTRRFMQLNDSKKLDFITNVDYETFNNSSSKTKNLTVSDTFGMMLIQIPGMSADKASAIVRNYPSIRIYLNALKQKANQKEKEDLLKDIEYGHTKRKLGGALSKNVANFYLG